MKLDRVDAAIINSLMQDGRKSFRQIAKEVNVSTPTVEARFSKMKRIGIIKNIEPIFDTEKMEDQIAAMVYLKTNPSRITDITKTIYAMSEAVGIYAITGEYNLVVKIVAYSIEHIEKTIVEKISAVVGVESMFHQIITRTIKEERSIPIIEGLSVKSRCIYCYNEITNNGKTLKVGHQPEIHFCCNSCLILYKQKYNGRIDTISK
jgi:Lrp/AsnC family transcriptional regulator for asnA, asnC and gidA